MFTKLRKKGFPFVVKVAKAASWIAFCKRSEQYQFPFKNIDI